ncbi:MAG: hypothetical protein GXN97_02320, partial [Aquificae bacterium]|nr:hypothetical protein [Aquificota bacterium]
MQKKRPKGLIAAEPNELVEMVLFQLGEHTGKIKGRGRPRTKGAKDVADLYVIAIANIEKTSTGVYSYISKDFLKELVESSSEKYKKDKSRRLFTLAVKLAEEKNKSIGLEIEKAISYYEK